MRDEVVQCPTIAHPIFCPDGASAGVEKGSGREMNSTVLNNVIGSLAQE